MKRGTTRLLQVAVAIGGCVPVAAGLAGVLVGPAMVGDAAAPPAMVSHFSYLSGLLLGIGLTFWSLIPHVEEQTTLFRVLTAIVALGGLSRALGIALHGMPPASMLFGLTMEIVITPLLCLWQGIEAARHRSRAALFSRP